MCTDDVTLEQSQHLDTEQQESINIGYEVLVRCGVQVTQALSRDPKTASSFLHSKGFVSDRLLEEITDLNVTRSDNGQKLYTAVLDVVKCFSHRYAEFISVLEEHDYNIDLVAVLKQTHSQLGKYPH